MNGTPDGSAQTLLVYRRVMNLAGFLTQAATRHCERAGLIEAGEVWSWRRIDGAASALARALADKGVAKGDRVLLHSKNCAAMFVAMFAIFRLGAVLVPTNFRLTPDEVVYMVDRTRATALLVHGDFLEHVEAVLAATDCVKTVGRIAGGGFGDLDVDAVVRGAPAAFADADVAYDDPVWFFFTSGTTGRPKAAVLTHGQMAFVITNHLCDLMPGTTEEDVSLVVAPLSHGAGIHQLTQVARGAVTVLPAGGRMDPAEIWELVERHGVTNMFTVPTIVKLLCGHPAVDAHDHSSLRYVIYAGAPMYREDQKHALGKLGPVLVQYFGLGEVTGCITVLPPRLHEAEDGPDTRIGTCGYPRTGVEISIQDDDGNRLGANETGEICVAGPSVFAGYFENPEANAKAFRDGWFRTGDLGHVDREGFLYITGRTSDMYISGGSNIYPREIEEKILAHPAVSEVAVLGVPDPVWGEVGLAVCVPVPGEVIDGPALLAWLGEKIPRYKLPKAVVVWGELPKSAYGKVPKRLVRDRLEERGELPVAAAEKSA
ncbi:MAG: acyl-CoA synthetase [Azospirillaceae bacterium]